MAEVLAVNSRDSAFGVSKKYPEKISEVGNLVVEGQDANCVWAA
jgi:hypothetical protein